MKHDEDVDKPRDMRSEYVKKSWYQNVEEREKTANRNIAEILILDGHNELQIRTKIKG